jgi:phage shock protein PspC (stress-responsive transcriptional regulator)
MRRRRLKPVLRAWLAEFIPLILGGVALGLSLAWAKEYLDLSSRVIDLILIALAVIGLLVAGVLYYRLYRAYLEDDEF